MKCPVCSFISSDRRDICPKCSVDLRPHKEALGLSVSYPDLPADELRKRYRGTARRKTGPKPRPARKQSKQDNRQQNWLLQLLGIGQKKKVKRRVRKKKPRTAAQPRLEQPVEKQQQTAPQPPAVREEAQPSEEVARSQAEFEAAAAALDTCEELKPNEAEREQAAAEAPSEESSPPQHQAEEREAVPESTAIKPSEIRSNIPQVAPEVLDLGDADDDEFEKLLDDMIGDVSFDVEAVAVEKRDAPSSTAEQGLAGLLDDDIEVSFELGYGEDDEEDDEDEGEEIAVDDEAESENYSAAAGETDEETEAEPSEAACSASSEEASIPESLSGSVLAHLLEDTPAAGAEDVLSSDREASLEHLLEEPGNEPELERVDITPEMLDLLELSQANEEDPAEVNEAEPVQLAEQPAPQDAEEGSSGEQNEQDLEGSADTSSDVAAEGGADGEDDDESLIEEYLAGLAEADELLILPAGEEAESEDDVKAYLASVGDEDELEVLLVEDDSEEEEEEQELEPPAAAEALPENMGCETHFSNLDGPASASAFPPSLHAYIEASRDAIGRVELVAQLVSALARECDIEENVILNCLPEFSGNAQPEQDFYAPELHAAAVSAVEERRPALVEPRIEDARLAELWEEAEQELSVMDVDEGFELSAGELVAFRQTDKATILFDLAEQELNGNAHGRPYNNAVPNSAEAVIDNQELEDEVRRLEKLIDSSTAESLEEAVIAVGHAIGGEHGMSHAIIPEVMFIVSDEEAPLWKRAAAKLIDAGICCFLGLVITAIFFVPSGTLGELFVLADWLNGVNAPYAVLTVIFGALLMIGGSTECVSEYGKSPGKALLGLRVASSADLAVTLPQAFARSCLETLSLFLLGLPLLAGLHNKLSKTAVVAEFSENRA